MISKNVEIKPRLWMDNYDEWLRQFVLLAFHNRKQELGQDVQISCYGLATSGCIVRFGKFTCSAKYLGILVYFILLV